MVYVMFASLGVQFANCWGWGSTQKIFHLKFYWMFKFFLNSMVVLAHGACDVWVQFTNYWVLGRVQFDSIFRHARYESCAVQMEMFMSKIVCALP